MAIPKKRFRPMRLPTRMDLIDRYPEGIDDVVNKRGCLGACTVRIGVSHDYGDERYGIEKRVIECVNMMADIDELRQDDGRVELLPDGGKDEPKNSVDVKGEWTGWEWLTFHGRDMPAALASAVKSKRETGVD